MSARKLYTADFETNTHTYDVSVWAYAVCEIMNVDNVEYGNSIDDFMDWCENHINSTVFFHNLKFDGEFIISWLLTNGFEWEKQIKHKNSFSTLIDFTGTFYSIRIKFEKKGYIEILDSLKKLPMPVAKIAKSFNLPILKGEIDYNLHRGKGHVMNDVEKAYIRNDVQIVAMALKQQIEQGYTRMTNASDALNYYKGITANFDTWFPQLDDYQDAFIRKSYKGGWTYLKKPCEIGEGIVLDVNSLYPFSMYDTLLPFGKPVFFQGEYQEDKKFPLYVQRFACQFKLKEKHLPMIQLKNNLRYNPVQYLEESQQQELLTLTSIDLKLFFDHYDVWDIEWFDGYKFRGRRGMFKNYIDFFYAQKATSTGGKRQIAKLMQNSLYGKFGSAVVGRSKKPYLDEKGIVKYETMDEEPRKPVYIPVASFITAYARNKTIRSAQKVYDRFVYADTDSLHLIGLDYPEGLEIHDTKLGAWAHESTFKRAKFIKPKTYIEDNGDFLDVKACGMPDNIKKNEVTYDNFKIGFHSNNKLQPKRFKGGVLLMNVPFQIK